MEMQDSFGQHLDHLGELLVFGQRLPVVFAPYTGILEFLEHGGRLLREEDHNVWAELGDKEADVFGLVNVALYMDRICISECLDEEVR